MSLSTPSLRVSLGLSYRCDAKRVDEPAGYVGLGWTLTGLGSVSRQICGQPDEANKGYSFRPDTKDIKYYYDLLCLQKDANADRYTVITPMGEALSFLLTDGEIEFLGYSELKIEWVANSDNIRAIDSFTVTNADGYVFEYTEKEMIEYNYQPDPVSDIIKNYYYRVPVSWHLTKIIAPDGADTIDIEYTKGTTWYKHKSESLYSMSYSWEGNPEGGAFGGGMPCKDDEEDDGGLKDGGYKDDGTLRPGDDFDDGPLRSVSNGMGIGLCAHTTYENPPLVKRITSKKNGSIELDYEPSTTPEAYRNGVANKLTEIRLLDSADMLVKRAVIKSSKGSGRRTLDKLFIHGDKDVLESYAFEYGYDDNGVLVV